MSVQCRKGQQSWKMATALFISRLSLVEIITSFGGDIMEYLSHISRAGNFHFPHILYKQYKCSRRKPMELWSNQFCWWSQFTPHTPTYSGILNFSSSSHHKHRAGIKGLKVLFNPGRLWWERATELQVQLCSLLQRGLAPMLTFTKMPGPHADTPWAVVG